MTRKQYVGMDGLEPSLRVLQTRALPVELHAREWVADGIEPSTPGL
jgi:hypothetical protein